MIELSRREFAASLAAITAIPWVATIAAVEETPVAGPGWVFVVNDVTRPAFASLPIKVDYVGGRHLIHCLLEETLEANRMMEPHRWVAIRFAADGRTLERGAETWSYREARIDAGFSVR